jgi:hypothetical protein
MDKTLVVCSSLALSLITFLLFPIPVHAEVGISPRSVNFGSVTVGTSGPVSTVVVTNGSQRSLSILNVNSTSPQFVVLSPTMPLTVEARQSASFEVEFQPNGVGTFAGSIVVSLENRGRGTSPLSVAVSGTAIAPALTYALSTSASSVSFPSTLVGSSTSQSISFTNSGSGTLTISQVTVSGAAFAVSGFSGTVSLASGNSISLTVTFTPTALGALVGTITIVSSAPNSPATISLSGTGVQPQISLVPSSVSFSNVSVGVTNTQSVMIKNTGTANLTVSQASLAGTTFAYSGLALPLTLPAGGSSTFTVAFAPTSASSFYANLSLVNNSPTSPLVVPLSGTSIAPILQLSASPTSVSFGSIATGASSTQTVTLTNSGNSSVSLSTLTVAGAGFSPSGTLPATLTAGQATTFGVVFAPTTAGSFSGTATVTSNASNSPLAIALTGTGSANTSYSVLLNMTYGSSSAVGFNVYRGSQSGGPYSRLNASVISATTYTDSTVASGQTYYYVATEVDSAGDESSYSAEVSEAIP